jgi:hypothetical protein
MTEKELNLPKLARIAPILCQNASSYRGSGYDNNG